MAYNSNWTLPQDGIDYLIHHVVLPPKLPQQHDSHAELERSLLTTTIRGLEKLQSVEPRMKIRTAIATLNNLLHCRDGNGFVNEGKLKSIFTELDKGALKGAIPLEIKKQNAAIIISKSDEDIMFELFELSPPNNVVMSAKGRLRRSFPSQAYKIPIATFREDGLKGSIAHTIAKLSSQNISDVQPTVRKNRHNMNEERDTTLPHMVTSYLANVISAIGNSAHVSGIWKNTREDVLWNNCLVPWRRSPLWLLIRVCLQLHFDREELNIYKFTMAFIMSEILRIATCAGKPTNSELLSTTMAKVSRRVWKLGHGSRLENFPTCHKQIQEALQIAQDLINKRWISIIQESHPQVHGIGPKALQAQKDLDIELPMLDAFVDSMYSREKISSVFNFQPTSEYPLLDKTELPNVFVGSDEDKFFTLAAIESWIEHHLNSWLDCHIADESTCGKLGYLIEKYHSSAIQVYAGVPRSISIMFLAIAELWVACDKSACHIHPLLKEYNPEMDFVSLQSLSLSLKSHMHRLVSVELYVRGRRLESNNNLPSVYRDFGHHQSFAVRFFDQSRPHQTLLSDIQARATDKREEKRRELIRMKKEHESLLQRCENSECEYEEVLTDSYHGYTETRHVRYCQKCALISRANSMTIRIHEWPLSSCKPTAKATVFELKIPLTFNKWRDTTIKTKMDILGFAYVSRERAENSYTLTNDDGLSGHFSCDCYHQRIRVLSNIKPHIRTHRNQQKVTGHLSEASVLLDNALRYRYHDSYASVFTAITAHKTNHGLSECVYELPGRSSVLQKYLFKAPSSPGCFPNEVIAGQSDCPMHLSLDEYKAFGVLPLGLHVSYLNILTQLAMPAVDFAKAETQVLVLQAIHHAGPPSGNNSIERISHSILMDSAFGDTMLNQLKMALRRTTENWESWRSLATFVQTAIRLLHLTASDRIRDECFDYLIRCRSVCRKWLQLITDRVNTSTDDEQRVELRYRATEVSLLCISTFDIDQEHACHVFADQASISVLLRCSITVQENTVSTTSWNRPLFQIMLQAWRSLMFRLYPIFERQVLRGVGLSAAVKASWSAFAPHGSWVFLPVPQNHWTTIKSGQLPVHFNLLTAELLVNGTPLSRLPLEYMRHAMYSPLFHGTSIEVVPTDEPGMRFSAKHTYQDYTLFFGMEDSNLLVRAHRGASKYELLPAKTFKNSLPAAFLENFVHWYNVNTNEVEFRNFHEPWSTPIKGSTWALRRCGRSWRLFGREITLVNPTSPTSRAVSNVLSPVEAPKYIHISYKASSGAIHIELPRLRIGFHINKDTHEIHSNQYRGKVVDSNQDIGTMIGLQNKLVLKDAQGKEDRIVLIPDGNVSYGKSDGHVQVSISHGVESKVYAYTLDTVLGRIIDDGSLQSKLYLSYLHGLTSYALPDPMTHHTGTEAALSILRTAAVRSFSKLSLQEVELLENIWRFTPDRVYYPKNLTVMQQVDWDSRLPFLSQHPEFYLLVSEIFEKAHQSQFFFSKEQQIELPTRKSINHTLYERDRIRNSTFSVSGFGAEAYNSSHDIEYSIRNDSECFENRGRSAFIAATLGSRHETAIHGGVSNLYSVLRQGQLENKEISGLQKLLDPSELRFDGKWIAGTASFLPTMWCNLHWSLSRPNRFNRFAFTMWISAVSFAEEVDLGIIQAFVAFYKSQTLAAIDIPQTPHMNLANGDVSSLDNIQISLHASTVKKSFQQSDESRIPRLANESAWAHEQRKRRNFEQNQNNALDLFARVLHNQWPVDQPTQPNTLDAQKYLDTTKAMEIVYPMFESWYNNRIFYKYLQKVSSALATHAQSAVPQGEMCSITPSTYHGIGDHERFMKTNDVFAIDPDVSLMPTPPSSPDLTKQEASAATTQDKAITRFKRLCSALLQQANSKSEEHYVSDLEDSFSALLSNDRMNKAVSSTLVMNANTKPMLDNYLAGCKKYLHDFNHVLACLFRDIGAVDHEVAPLSIHLPRISPIFWLSQLNIDNWKKLSAAWRYWMISYGLAITNLHRARRMVAHSSNPQDLMEEYLNPGHQSWKPEEHPEYLLLEAESGILIRRVQAEIAKNMIYPPEGKNSVMQLNMGEGKSSVIVPVAASTLSDRKALVRVVVAKPQSKQMLQMLVSKLGGLLNRRVYHMPFSRALKITEEHARTISRMYHECMKNRGILLVQPEHILSFQLMGIECRLSDLDRTADLLLSTQQFFDEKTRDIVDESDENFSVKFELIYTMGTQRSIEMSPERWNLIHAVLALVSTLASDVKDQLPSSIELDIRDGRYPRVRTLRDDADGMLVHAIAKSICEKGLPGFAIHQQPKPLRSAIYRYITSSNLSPSEVSEVESSSYWTESTCSPLLLVRGLLACGVLRFAFRTKRWRVNFGVDPNRVPATKLAVPFRSKDSPSPRSEFSHPDVVIVLTSLTYYYGGLTDEELFDSFSHLMNSDQADIEYIQWVAATTSEFSTAYHHLAGINLKDKYRCTIEVFPHLRYSKGAIDYFLSHIVFPKEMKEFPSKLSASGWDLGRVKSNPTTGFSGTNDSQHVLPLSVKHLDLSRQKHTNALVLSYILQDESSIALLPRRSGTQTDAEHLLGVVNFMQPETRVILDVGAQILELNNLQVAEKWLFMSNEDIQAVIFFDDNEDISVLDRSGRIEILQTSPFAKQLDLCLVYLDEAHTRGTDLKLPRNYRAAVTLGASLTKDRLVQACMRMRKLGKGQSVVFCIPEEIQTKIRDCTSKSANDNIEVSDVLTWAITETWIDTRRSMPLWATQGRRFEEYEGLLNGSNTSMEQAKAFLEDEAQTLDQRYRPRSQTAGSSLKSWDRSNENIAKIIARCEEFEAMNFNSATLHEEQERELSPEIEEERQVQRPAPMSPENHLVHPDLIYLIGSGRLRENSDAFIPAFQSLKSTSAAKHFNPEQFPIDLLVTADYARTVKMPSIARSTKSHISDSYHRPVQWVLSVPGMHGIQRLVVLSPAEVDKLWPKIRETSKVTLHLYAPRNNQVYEPLDELELFTAGRAFSPGCVPPTLSAQLNLFAGQLYFRSMEEYVQLCQFLGLASDAAKDGEVVSADGFINPPVGAWGLKKSPVRFLREVLVKVRREGEGADKTHLGRMLNGELLRPGDFE
ncbi:hypothetical protein BS50DRAFT_616434 [Corynespora cassiicola Philippines]|uniref:ubiquitinyl hydrolase 1 n=1 Tax=Corynespora cassiicola Philippines TaxID=1448308 RepID=A0A2T2P5R9_CORCC|nr:hypothetical protein BS50DRAFT_616434 [Corynespora cassiicola Philippines]